MTYEEAKDVLKAIPLTALYNDLDKVPARQKDAALIVALTTLRMYRLDVASRDDGLCQGDFYAGSKKLLEPFEWTC